MKFQRKKVALALGMGGVALVAGGTAAAQDIRVNVTGSNIKRVDSETAAPIETITREDIQQSGLQTIQDVLRQITASNQGGISPSFTSGFSASGAAVSLRGLGSNNTLVLLNGRRIANFGLADDGHISYADLSQIPFDAVERIEVLKDGASAIYGADAVAGVVNVILRQQYTGFTATATGGVAYNGEGTQYKVAATGGIGDLTKDRYNAFLTVDYQKQDAYPENKTRGDYTSTNDLRFMGFQDQRGGNPTTIYPSSSSLLGNTRPVNPVTGGSPGTLQSLAGPCAAGNLDSQGFCRYEPMDFRDITPEIERLNVLARGAYNFTDSIQGYTELSYFQVKTDTRDTPTSTRASWYNPTNLVNPVVTSNNIFLPVGHPDNPFNATNQGARLYYLASDLTGGGGRNTHYETDTQRYLVGLKGTAWSWDWDMAGLYIRSDTDVDRRGFFQYDRLQQGLAGTGPYGYYRIGANANLNDPAIYPWISPTLSYSAVSENTTFDIKGSRDIYQLDGGQLALAIGYEYRREEINNPGVPGTGTGNIVGLGYAKAIGSRNDNALFAELYAPILKNLDVTAAIRYDDYSDFGSTWNPKVGVKWTAIPSLVLRGTYATAFRAPGLYESSQAGGTAGFVTATDPVTGTANLTVLGISQGNPGLKPETSDTWTVGVIWEPIPGLSGTLDYWNIKTTDAISIVDVQATVNNPANFPNSTIYRDASGTLIAVSNPFFNAGKVETDGIDLDIVWKQSLKEWGMLTTEFQWTHIFEFKKTVNGITYSYVGTLGDYNLSSGSATPEDRWNLIIGWQQGPWNVTGTVRYVSGWDEIPYKGLSMPGNCQWTLKYDSDGSLVQNCSVDSFTTFDLAASYSGFKNWQIFGSIINLFNEKAPFAPAAHYGQRNLNYNYAFAGATGTQFNLGARYTFQ